MKVMINTFFVLAFVSSLVSISAAPAWAFKSGDKAEVEWDGTWYPATVKEAKDGMFFISYEGYESSWDEWVGPDRIRKAGTASKAASGAKITIRKGGSLWASVEPNGTIRIDGSIAGEFSSDGTVRKSGSIVGSVEGNGTIRKGGSLAGTIETGGTLRRDGSIVGSIESNGTIRLNGSLWGSASSCCGDHNARRAVAAVIVFFAADFGY